MRVDFYILQGEANRELFACRLCEKAYKQQLGVYLQAESQQHAQQIDNLLWTFNDGGFVPHQLINEIMPAGSLQPALIGWTQTPPSDYSLLINLTEAIPSFYAQFERIAEIVNQQEHIRQAGRQRYTQYRDHDCELQHHEL